VAATIIRANSLPLRLPAPVNLAVKRSGAAHRSQSGNGVFSNATIASHGYRAIRPNSAKAHASPRIAKRESNHIPAAVDLSIRPACDAHIESYDA
jgi:hypothetical protein